MSIRKIIYVSILLIFVGGWGITEHQKDTMEREYAVELAIKAVKDGRAQVTGVTIEQALYMLRDISRDEGNTCNIGDWTAYAKKEDGEYISCNVYLFMIENDIAATPHWTVHFKNNTIYPRNDLAKYVSSMQHIN